MSSVATPGREVRPFTLSDRLLAALPLASIYIWLCAVYAFEAWRRITPWLFGDELEFTQLSRSIADTGHPAERGYHHSPDSIYTYLIAPLWRIHDVAAAYSAIKYVDVLVMAAVVFPTYLLARMVVGKAAALFAAAGAGAIPALAYSSYIVEEPLAYPYAMLCVFLIAKALLSRDRRWIVGAIVASLVAPAIRGELVVIPALFALALVFTTWSSDAARRWRAGWSRSDWLGAVVLALGAIFLVGAIGSDVSDQIRVATVGFKHRQINEGNWAAGTLALGMGVLPFMAGLAALFPVRGEVRSRELTLFRSVATATLVTFGLYTAIKAAYLSTTFATRVEERNLIYIAPVLFIGTALVFSRRRVSWFGLAASAAYTLYLVGYALYHVTQYPYQMGVQLYSDALGFAIVQQGNRDLGWTPHFVRILLVVMTVIALGVLLAATLLRARERTTAVIVLAAAVGVIGWNLTGEIAASAGTNSVARQAGDTLKRPFSWVDAVAHGKPTVYLGQEEIDQNPEWLIEFWNRSITRISSLDGTLGGPGFSGGPNFTREGVLYQGEDFARGVWRDAYAVEDLPCIQLAGTPVGTHPYRAGGLVLQWRLMRLSPPDRMLADCTGIYPDGWSSANDSFYYRFSGPAGWLRVAYSRPENYPVPPTPVHITLGTLKIEKEQPALARTTATIRSTIANLQSKVAWLHVPAGGFAVHFVVEHKFVPDSFDHRGDRRELGAQLTYRFFLTKPHR